MGSYELLFTKSFDRDFRSLPRQEAPKILKRVLHLEQEPRPVHSRKLKGTKNEYRLRVGDYRVFYTIDDPCRVITVYHVAHRREAYR